jgi:hypothetical protein
VAAILIRAVSKRYRDGPVTVHDLKPHLFDPATGERPQS